MKHNVKRTLSLLLALALAVSLFPTLSVPVSALYLEDTSLQCTWTLQDDMPLSDGTTGLKLTIRPTNGDSGRMDYYAYLAQNWVSTAPWAFYILQIEEVELTDGVLNAGGNIMSFFQNKSLKLKKVIFADSVQEIGWNAFYRDHADETPLEVDWGSGIKSVESTAFTRSGVTEVCLPAIEEIGVSAFQQCHNLESVYLASKNWLNMDKSVFEGCTNLKEATLAGYVRGIPAYTFSGCEKLQSIALPATVERVEKDAFKYCTSLSAVYYAGTPQQWAQISIAEGNECLQNATVIYNSKPYTITFDPNGGYVSPESMVTAASGKLPSLPTPTRSGYSFVGWFTEPEGGSSVSTNTVFNGDTTIYAHWFRYMDSTCAVTVNPPMAGYHPATTAKSTDTSRYKATAVYFCPLNGGTEGPQMTAAVELSGHGIHVRIGFGAKRYFQPAVGLLFDESGGFHALDAADPVDTALRMLVQRAVLLQVFLRAPGDGCPAAGDQLHPFHGHRFQFKLGQRIVSVDEIVQLNGIDAVSVQLRSVQMRLRRGIAVLKGAGIRRDRNVQRFCGGGVDGRVHRLQQFEYERSRSRCRRVDHFDLRKGSGLHMVIDARRDRCRMIYVLALFDARIIPAVHGKAQILFPGRLPDEQACIVQKFQISGALVLQQDITILAHLAKASA